MKVYIKQMLLLYTRIQCIKSR
uniref:Uncharacterized protein n=1 Tax=Rhizophora mucronata TaxID=61149 RepID=A0A2P2N6X3_RHIMU